MTLRQVFCIVLWKKTHFIALYFSITYFRDLLFKNQHKVYRIEQKLSKCKLFVTRRAIFKRILRVSCILQSRHKKRWRIPEWNIPFPFSLTMQCTWLVPCRLVQLCFGRCRSNLWHSILGLFSCVPGFYSITSKWKSKLNRMLSVNLMSIMHTSRNWLY